jgi:serine/threonine protein kinase/tetratricopeptide (TPR) repeat protein
MSCPHCSSPCDPNDTWCPACGASLEPKQDQRVGTVLPGGYVLQECIGGGGMGQVYRAEQSNLGRSVAVKIVHPALLSDEGVAKRFINEARLASRLNHPNSVAVIDFGRTEEGLLYLVMEHLRGRDLARVLVEDGLLSFERTIDILRQLLDVLSEAHQLDIVHLDLKPDNIILEPTRRGGDFVKVVDFGLARMLEGTPHTSGPSNTIAGTPDYMSPEQCRGESPDARSDLYAVGVVLFLLLTGKLPFEAESPTQVLLNHLSMAPPDPRKARPERGIPDGLVEVLTRALAKHPNDRFQTAAEFSESLAEVRFQITSPMRMPTVPPGAPTKPCKACGEPVPTIQKFCGSCGARTPWADRLPSLRPSAIPVLASSSPTIAFPFPFTARGEDLDWLLSALARCANGSNLCRVEGEVGVGRTRLLEEFDKVASAIEHPVYWVKPEPWPIGPPWRAVRALVSALVGLSESELLSVAESDVVRGLRLIFGRDDTDHGLARAAAAGAVRWALEQACERAAEPVVLLVDDCDQSDGASRNALSDALQMGDLPRLFVVVVHGVGYGRPWLEDTPRLVLKPFSHKSAVAMLGASQLVDSLQKRSGDVLPLYLEQLARFDLDGGTEPPERLGDLIAARLARLRADRRRVLQAVAVLGPAAPQEQVMALVGDGVDVQAASRDLDALGFFSRVASCYGLAHPLLRQIARATTPAAVLRDLHAKAIDLAGASLPLEVRTYHMQQAGDGFGALLNLERVGVRAQSRDDLDSALEAFRSGFELARRSAGDPDLDDPMHAVALFGRKLGEALAQMGRYGEAEGILRESLDFSSTARQRARVTFALARVARLRGNPHKALELAREAIDLAIPDRALVTSFEKEAIRWKS